MLMKENINMNQVEKKSLSNIPPVLRTLLNSSGIVINFLEAYFEEKMKVVCLYQDSCQVSERQWPGIGTDENILFRNVLINGVESDKCYAYATSFIRLDKLAENIVDDLLICRKGIGEIINERKIETYREIIEIEKIDSNIIRSIFSEKGEIVSRKYRIYIDGIEVMLITEYYPVDIYR